VIFCHDVEKCLSLLDDRERELIKRITLQEYSQGEAAAMVGISLRSCIRQYGATLDRLTRILMRAGMLEPQKACQ
jgi:DNA-directed RNA polymerase specialized sigma24 family protein